LVERGFGATGLSIAVLISYVIKTICMSGYIKYILRNERLHNNNTYIQ
jgi:Tfp pilus assembly protein PilE